MRIGGYQPCSLCDYDGYIAAVVFTQGCNYRCPYCHNGSLLALTVPSEQLIPVANVLTHLKQRSGQIDAVVISGGEPTLQQDLPDFLRTLKDMGLMIKVDTNGSRPHVLSSLLSMGVVDYVAMDIKAPWSSYHHVAGLPISIVRTQQSIEVIRKSGIPHEFRTTLVPGLLTEEDISAIQSIVPKGSLYRTQPFRPLLVSSNENTSSMRNFVGD